MLFTRTVRIFESHHHLRAATAFRAVRLLVLLPLVLVALATTTVGYESSHQLRINRVEVDETTNQMKITGVNFGGVPPTVTLEENTLHVISYNPTQILVYLPAGITPGTYLLKVSMGNGTPMEDTFYVAVGALGSRGEPGPQGAQGPQGEVGPQGRQGDIGPVGPRGPQGETGAKGSQGSRGDTGATGAQGPVGPTGETGARGVQGELGPQGAQGEKGDRGDAGSQGPQGETGAQGPAGQQGPQGEVGPQGPAGPQGSAGPTGPQGPQGPQGSPGPASIEMIVTFNGNINSIPGNVTSFVFAGPTATFTTTATQRLTGSGSAPLASTNGGGQFFAYGLCYQSTSAGSPVVNFNDLSKVSIGSITSDSTRISWAASASVVPGAGTWNVGFCVRNHNFFPLDFNGSVSGWVMVTN
jgi:hypothetical protein